MLTIYAPLDNTKRKGWEVFDGIKKTWPNGVAVKNNTDTDASPPATTSSSSTCSTNF